MAAPGPSNLPIKPYRLFHKKEWQSCYISWLERMYQRCESTGTVRVYQYIMRDLFSDPARNPDSYTTQEVESYLRKPRKRDGKPPSPYTYNHKLGIMQSFYSYAASYEIPFRNSRRMLLHTHNPTSGIRQLPTHQIDRTLSEEEMHRLLAVIPRDTVRGLRDRALILMYFWTGRRKSEIIRLTWGDIEWDQGRWIYHFRGKGHRAIDDKDELHPRAKQALDEYLIASGRMETIQPEDPLFLPIRNRDETHGLRPGSVDKALHKYWEAAGLHGSCHWFRHTHAYELYKATDKDIMKVSRRLRHSSVEHTRRYLEAAEVLEATEMARLDAKFGDL